jgi:hypothetical protein
MWNTGSPESPKGRGVEVKEGRKEEEGTSRGGGKGRRGREKSIIYSPVGPVANPKGGGSAVGKRLI